MFGSKEELVVVGQVKVVVTLKSDRPFPAELEEEVAI